MLPLTELTILGKKRGKRLPSFNTTERTAETTSLSGGKERGFSSERKALLQNIY